MKERIINQFFLQYRTVLRYGSYQYYTIIFFIVPVRYLVLYRTTIKKKIFWMSIYLQQIQSTYVIIFTSSLLQKRSFKGRNNKQKYICTAAISPINASNQFGHKFSYSIYILLHVLMGININSTYIFTTNIYSYLRIRGRGFFFF